MNLYQRTDAATPVVKMSRGRYRLGEFLKAATEQGLLVVVEPTDRICIKHWFVVTLDETDCESFADGDCVMRDIVRVTP